MAIKPKKPAVKAVKTPAKKASGKALSPLEKARLARAGSKSKTKVVAKKKVRPGSISVQAPEDFKPHFLLVQVRSEKDGLLGASVKATRILGNFGWDVEDKKKFDLGSYDQETLVGVATRLGAATYKPTKIRFHDASPKERMAKIDAIKAARAAKAAAEEKGKEWKGTIPPGGSARLPKGTVFSVLLRIGKKKADNTLMVRVKSVFQAIKSEKSGRVIQKELEKADPVFRAFRGSGLVLPVAFKDVKAPPKRTRTRKTEQDDE